MIHNTVTPLDHEDKESNRVNILQVKFWLKIMNKVFFCEELEVYLFLKMPKGRITYLENCSHFLCSNLGSYHLYIKYQKMTCALVRLIRIHAFFKVRLGDDEKNKDQQVLLRSISELY